MRDKQLLKPCKRCLATASNASGGCRQSLFRNSTERSGRCSRIPLVSWDCQSLKGTVAATETWPILPCCSMRWALQVPHCRFSATLQLPRRRSWLEGARRSGASGYLGSPAVRLLHLTAIAPICQCVRAGLAALPETCRTDALPICSWSATIMKHG